MRTQRSDEALVRGIRKWTEDYQIIGREVFHFDDREVAREALTVSKYSETS